MNFWAIVPVKSLQEGKSRLADLLSEAERYDLNLSLLEHTLEVLEQARGVERVLVVSPDAQVRSRLPKGIAFLTQDGDGGLNEALHQATTWIQGAGPAGALVLPSDLPLVQPSDVEEILAEALETPCIVLVPDRHDSGTNALAARPAGVIGYHFGIHSFQVHCRKARELHIPLRVLRNPALGLDLDLAEDLEILRGMDVTIPGLLSLDYPLTDPRRN